MPNKKRTEFDTLGIKKIDSQKLWGAQTQRSLKNFKIGNDKIEKIISKKNRAAEIICNLNKIDNKKLKEITYRLDKN